MRLWPRKQVYVDDLPRTHDIRFAALFVIMFVAILALVYTVGFFVAGNRLPRGTSVAGVEVGGMSRGEARAELQDELLPRLQEPITVHALDQTFKLDPQGSGLTFDIEKTLSNGLAGERWDPRHMLKVVMGGGPLDAVIVVDHGEIDATLEQVAATVDHAPVEASVRFTGGKPAAIPGEAGVALDYVGSKEQLIAALLEGDAEVDLPVETVEAEVTTTEASDFLVKVAEPAVAAPVRIRVADAVRTVQPGVFGPALRTRVVDGELRLAVAPDVLAQRSRAVLASLPHRPVDATIAFRNGRPVVVAGRSGVSVSPDAWGAAVVAAAGRRGDARVARASVTPDQPAFSTQEARTLGIKELMVTAQLRVPGSAVADVRNAAARLDASVVRPGDTFSLRRQAGPPADPWSGSILASAVYDAAFRSGMGTINRTAPSTRVAGTEPGFDALAAPGADLTWRNGTPYGVYIRAILAAPSNGAGQLTVQFWSTRYLTIDVSSSGRYNVVVPDVQRQSGQGCRARPGIPGFEVDVRRALSGEGTGQRVETEHSRYNAVDGVSCARQGRR